MNDISSFEKLCITHWGKPERSSSQIFDPKIKRIQDFVEFSSLSNNLKAHIAEKLIRESLSIIGRMTDSGDVNWYIYHFAKELTGIDKLIDGRRLYPLKAALLLVREQAPSFSYDKGLPEDLSIIFKGGSSLATSYLLPQLEYFFRIKSRYTDENGIIIKEIPPQLIYKLKNYSDQNLEKGKRINQINITFLTFLYRNTTSLAKRLRVLERRLFISKRLKRIRNPMHHGELSDILAEGQFYALLLAMFYYSENN